MPLPQFLAGEEFSEDDFLGNNYAKKDTGLFQLIVRIVEHVANAYRGTSTTSLTVVTGSKNLTVTGVNGQIPAFGVGAGVHISLATDVANTFMEGKVTAYSGETGAMTVDVTGVRGSGTHADWVVSFGGLQLALSSPTPLAHVDGGTGASTPASALAGLTPAVSKILATTTTIPPFGVAIYAAGDDEYPGWYDGVDGPRAALIGAVAKFDATPNSHVELFDLTDDTTPSLVDFAITGQITCIAKDLRGGRIAVGTTTGVRVLQFRRGGLELVGSYFTGLEITSVAVGYSDDPAVDAGSGGRVPTVACTFASGADVVGVVKDDGQTFVAAGTSGQGTACAIAGGEVIYNKNVNGVFAASITSVAADDWPDEAILTDNTIANPAFVADNAIAVGHRLIAGAAPEGLTLARDFSGAEAENNGIASNRVLATAKINNAYSTGWMLGATRAAWLVNSKTADRSNNGNTLTETGTVSSAVVATNSDLTAYGQFGVANYLEQIANTSLNFGDPEDIALYMGWVRVGVGAVGTQTLFEQRDGVGLGLTVTIDWSAANGLKFTPNFANGGNADTVQTGGLVTDDDALHMVVFAHDSLLGQLRCFVNGTEVARTATTKNGLGSADQDVRFGLNFAGANAGANLEAWLWRVCSSRPNGDLAEFVAMAYADEKELMVANAKAFLQGAAPAVADTAIDVGGKVWAMQADVITELTGLAVTNVDATPGGLVGTVNQGVARRLVNDISLEMLGTDQEAHIARTAMPISNMLPLIQSAEASARLLDGVAFRDRVQVFDHLVAIPAKELTDAATINWDVAETPMATVTLGGNRTLAAPTNAAEGGYFEIRVQQDGTGSRTLSFNAAYHFVGKTAPSLTAAANSVDRFTFHAIRAGNAFVFEEVGRGLNIGATA